jgi:16S rRNA (cytidine1402-2'-O)-methyltransferase
MATTMNSGKLYILATPIGNLEDISLRTLRLLKEADLVLCEDTRTSGILLKHYDIKQPLQSYHKFNEHQLTERVIAQLQAGKTIALISDAGTPGISDPGFLLARAAVAAGLEVEAPPGATALIPALVKSGLPSDRFCFEGFLPQKKGRQTRLKQLAEETRTMVFYESPYRVLKSLEELAQYCGAERQASVSREITKKFEETVNGSLAELIQHFKTHAPKGEFVIVLAGRN